MNVHFCFSQTRRFVPTVSALILLACLTVTGCLHTMEPIDPATLPITSASGQRLRNHVSLLASPGLQGRKPGTQGNQQAAQYIEGQFREAGLESLPSLGSYRQAISPEIGDNLVGIIPPAAGTGPARWLLIGAHYDHLGDSFLGADDNASSIAILLETARHLATPSRHGIVFVAFNSEERPYFGTPEMGSQFFFHHLPQEIGVAGNLQAVIIMDLMGGVHWSPLKDTIFATGAEKSPQLYQRLKETAAPASLTVSPIGIHLVEEIPAYGHKAFSDYDVFRNHSVPFLFLSAGRTPRYHSPKDAADTLQYERMAATVEWLRRLMALIDQDPTVYTFDAQRVEFADETAVFRKILEQATQDDRLIPGTSRWSLYQLRKEAEWLRTVDSSVATPQKLNRLEQISIRFQCLMADFSGCFMF